METKSQIPRKFTVGDTVSWTEVLPDYPSSLYTISIVLIAAGTDSIETFTATGDNDNHTFTISTTDSAGLTAGRYDFQLIATGDGYRNTLDRGSLEILADLSALTSHDGRDWLDKAIDALEASIAGRASKVQMERSFDGVTIKELTPLEQLELLNKLYARRNARNLKNQRGKGKSLSRIIGVSF